MMKTYRPDVIVTDIRMPVLDGLGLIKRLRDERFSDAMIIVLSGYKDFEYAKEALENGAFSYLLKPIDNRELVEKVLAALKELDRRRDVKKLDEKVRQDLHVLQREFLFDVIKGRILSDREIREKAAAYGLSLPESGVVVHAVIDKDTHPSPEMLARRAQAFIEGLTLDMDLNRQHLNVVDHPDSSTTTLVPHVCVETVLGHLHAVLESIEGREQPTWSIGVSDAYRSPMEIAHAYAVAKVRSAHKAYPMLDTVVTTDTSRTYKPQVEACLRHIAGHYRDALSVKTVSEALDISESNLMHTMKAATGKTFNEYLTDYRMMVAKKLLKRRGHRVNEVARKVGFKDEKYFSQVFKRREGMTPTAYMKKGEERDE